MRKKNYPAGWLSDISFVVIFANYQGKWGYCFHKRRASFEHPGGHVEPGESPMQAARRELYEESGIKDCKLTPLWDYEQIWEDGTEKRSSGMKGTYIKVLNDMVFDEVEKLRKESIKKANIYA